METKKWYQSRVIQLAILQGIIGILVTIDTQYPNIGFVVILKAILDAVLRVDTVLPIDTLGDTTK